eukprot:12227298-Alexandrium_andersonii.AAC.1
MCIRDSPPVRPLAPETPVEGVRGAIAPPGEAPRAHRPTRVRAESALPGWGNTCVGPSSPRPLATARPSATSPCWKAPRSSAAFLWRSAPAPPSCTCVIANPLF